MFRLRRPGGIPLAAGGQTNAPFRPAHLFGRTATKLDPFPPGEGGTLAVLTLRSLHVAGAWVAIIGNAAAGLWALGAHWWPWLRTRALWRFTAAVEAAIFVQVGFGVAMVAGQNRPAAQFHMFYGFVALVAVGIIYSYRQQLERWRYLLYGLGGLFLMGLGLRALTIGSRP